MTAGGEPKRIPPQDEPAALPAGDAEPAGAEEAPARTQPHPCSRAQAYRRLLRSWAATAAGLTALDAAGLALEARRGGRDAAVRAVPGLAFALTVMHVDTLIHLRQTARDQAPPPRDTLGLPVTLTLLRRTIAAFLWAHLLGGRPVMSRRALSALLALGAASDVVDGAVARRRDQVTPLGAYLDAEADFSFWSSLVLTLGALRLLPRWLIPLLFLRFGVPVALAGMSHLALRRPVKVSSTVVGKAAAVAQMVACVTALRPARKPGPLDAAVHVLTAVLMLAAPIAQARRILGAPPSCTPAPSFQERPPLP
jgi:CDP-diacylglycerol---glycerol-3-phosphate 3-phosphatidyltransferase